MKFFKYLIPFLVVATTASAQIGQQTAFDRQLRTRDDQAVRDFVQSKESIDVKKKASNLDISGDVRFEWQRIQERGVTLTEDECSYSSTEGESSSSIYQKVRDFRGDHRVGADRFPLSVNNFDVEFNLKLKYSYENAWAQAHLQFDNPMGSRAGLVCRSDEPVFNASGDSVVDILDRKTRRALKGSGISSFLNLKRAYLGYTIWADGKHRLDVECGRRKFDDVFVSEVQFSNRFDGILLKYASAIESIDTDVYLNVGSFVIDQRVNHFGFVGEIGLLNIGDTGLDIRYSFIDWQKKGWNRCKKNNPKGTDFANSQISFSYNITPTLCDYELPIEFYGGFLVNHAAKKNFFTHNKKENLAGYAGVLFGRSIKKGDWSFDIEYIYIQAQAVPDADVGSIGRGNIFNEGLYDVVVANDGSGFVYYPRRGNGNFSGVRAEFLYLLTDNLSLDFITEYSRVINKKIGGHHHYTCFEIEAIYAF